MTAGLTRGRPKLWNCSPQIALSRLGEERELKAPVTLPKLSLLDAQQPDIDDTATRFAEYRAIRAGRDGWEEIGRAEGFESWKLIGAALAVGKHHALKITGANAAWGRNYSRAFGEWIKANGFDAMAKSVRSVTIELHENANAIEAWRATLAARATWVSARSVT